MPTTIKLKNSVTTTNAPSSLAQGEVAINITDKKVWVGNAATTPIQLLGAGASGTFGALTCTSLTNSGLTSGRVTYASTGGLLADSANFTFNGTTVTMANDASISGLTVGKGGGAVSSNTALGGNAMINSTASSSRDVAVGYNALYYNTNGQSNTAIGCQVLQSNTTGLYNTAVGDTALFSNTTASNNTAVGYQSLYSNTTGGFNTAFGDNALYSNTTASYNTALGRYAARLNTTGTGITAVGHQALASNTTGSSNIAVGGYDGTSGIYAPLYDNTTGSYNIAIGVGALRFNTTASFNTAVGYSSLYYNTTGQQNVSLGYFALYNNTTGSYNSVTGLQSMSLNTTGSNNTANGFQALYSNTTASNNTAVGYQAGYSNTTGGNLTAVGYQAGYYGTGTLNTYIGYGSGTYITTGSRNTILGGYGGNQDGLDIRTASNYAVIADGDGNRLLSMYNGGTLALDGSAVPQAGTGITFPATQSASSDANTLDDYEEGTWTPTITRNTTQPTITYGAQDGRYVKIGRIVYASCNVSWSANTGGSGLNWFISGLPFTNSANTGNYAQGTIQDFNGITFTVNRTQFGGYVNTSDTRFFLCSGGSGVNTENITVGSSGYMYMSVVYMAAS